MEAIGEPGMFADHRVTVNPVPVGYGMIGGEHQSGVITFPEVKGGIVTRMTVNPMNGMIADMHITLTPVKRKYVRKDAAYFAAKKAITKDHVSERFNLRKGK